MTDLLNAFLAGMACASLGLACAAWWHGVVGEGE